MVPVGSANPFVVRRAVKVVCISTTVTPLWSPSLPPQLPIERLVKLVVRVTYNPDGRVSSSVVVEVSHICSARLWSPFIRGIYAGGQRTLHLPKRGVDRQRGTL